MYLYGSCLMSKYFWTFVEYQALTVSLLEDSSEGKFFI